MSIRKISASYTAKPSEIEKKWYIVDATDLVLGRLASIVANHLRGKHKPTFTPNIDCGDFVIVVNADKIHLTGRKYENKIYHHYTGYVGGLKSKTAREIMEGKFPERVLENAVRRMITRRPLGRQQMKKLFIYSGSEHPHSAQKPEVLNIAEMNPKNKKRKQ
jgi:large subunit ribosomal protein L13